MQRITLIPGLCHATTQTVAITDITGCTVKVEKNPDHIVLAKGRMIYALALLDCEAPFCVGCRLER